MSRTLPLPTQKVFEMMPGFKEFYDVFKRSEQLIFDEFFEEIEQYRAAIKVTNLLPMEILPWVILLAERNRNSKIFNELYRRLDELEKSLEELEPPEQP